MINNLHNRTPEQYKAAAAKGVATRRAKREAKELARLSMLDYRDKLSNEIEELENRLAVLQRMDMMSVVSAAVTGRSMLTADEIARAAVSWEKQSGVYFLLDGNEVVYVGQAVNVYTRIHEHSELKKFNRYAFVPCKVEVLDVLESLYIHVLKPRLNGNYTNGQKNAPMNMEEILDLINKMKHKKEWQS